MFMYMCTLVYFNQVLKQGMVYSCIPKPDTQTGHTNRAHKLGTQTGHTNWAHKPGSQTGHTNQAHKPGIHTAFYKILILHVAFQHFSIPSPTFITIKRREIHIITPAHANRLASFPGYPFSLSFIHMTFTCINTNSRKYV